MASIILFHSVFGLRQVEHEAAERFRAIGYDVAVPDLFAGQSADAIDGGFALMNAISWPLICERAEEAIGHLPADTVLAGISMGAGVVASLWPSRADTKGVLLLHGLASIPETARRSLPVQVHLAEPDGLFPSEQWGGWREDALRQGLSLEMFEYPGAGHFFTDRSLGDHDAGAADKTWARAIRFLEGLS